jgi:Arc/MetJ family transcription regulator
MCMRTTVIIKDEVLKEAADLTGIKEKTALIHAGLKALIEKEATKRLIALGGSDPNAKPGRRRRP